MNAITQVTTLIGKVESGFSKMVEKAGTGMCFQQEALFAQQFMMNNDYLMKTALKNPNSLVSAVLNTASIGISLNPALGLAYLVPRDGRVILDISYRGLVKLATDTGAVLWAKAELVYSGDHFRYRGPATIPEHSLDPFAKSEDRGEFRGAYCIAKLGTGDFMIETMSVDDINKVRDKSASFTREGGAKGPWVDWPEEMRKKTTIKRARKSWPASSPRLDQAIHLLNSDNGEGFSEAGYGRDYAMLESKALEDSGVRIGTIESQGTTQSFDIPDNMRKRVEALVQRAEGQKSWKAAIDWANDRLRGPALQYALTQLKQSEQRAVQTAH